MRCTFLTAPLLLLITPSLDAQATLLGDLGRLPSDRSYTSDVALGDLDGDGDLDAFATHGGTCDPGGCYGRLDLIYMNDGTGFFHLAANALPAHWDFSCAVALGDVDGDGDLDALVGCRGSSAPDDRLYINDGLAHFSDASAQLPSSNPNTQDVALADVDGDGDLDAFIAGGGMDRLLLNDGGGRFSDASQNLPAHTDWTNCIAFGDLDGDGDLDALLAHYGANRLYLNNGIGVFTESGGLPAHIQDTCAIALGDLDGDGDLDAFLANIDQPQLLNRLYLNTGSGLFVDATAQLPASLNYTMSIGLGDLDADGDLDILLGNGEQPNRLYLNDGAAVFSDATARIPYESTLTHAVAMGDLDGDEDLDAFLANGDAYRIRFNPQNRTYTGLARQLAARGRPPRVGQALTLDLWGPALGTWSLVLSSGAAAIPLAPHGTWRLDPSALYFVANGALDAQREGTASFAIPADPLLVGATLHWQALLAAPLQLSNREQTTFYP